jgi:sec-independent protein translocase protein TatA
MLVLHLPILTAFPLFPAWVPGPLEWFMIAAIGLLFFGKRLPEVGRSLGKGIVEFKKGLKGVEDDIETASNRPEQLEHRYDPETGKPNPAYKFDPHTGKPLKSGAAAESESA